MRTRDLTGDSTQVVRVPTMERPRVNQSTKMSVSDLAVWYGEKQALHGVSLDVYENEVTALIGPSGCGKSTFLRCLNRMNDLVPGVRIEGEVVFEDGEVVLAGEEAVPGQQGAKRAPQPSQTIQAWTCSMQLPECNDQASGLRPSGLVFESAGGPIHRCIRRWLLQP